MSDEHRLFELRTNSKLDEETFKIVHQDYTIICLPKGRLYKKKRFISKKLKTLLFERSYDSENYTIKLRYKTLIKI